MPALALSGTPVLEPRIGSSGRHTIWSGTLGSSGRHTIWSGTLGRSGRHSI